MCPPKVKIPDAPKAPPPIPGAPQETATRIGRVGGKSRTEFGGSASAIERRMQGLSSLRVDLAVPSSNGGGGLFVPRG